MEINNLFQVNDRVNDMENGELNLLEEKYNQVVSEIALIREKLTGLREKVICY